MIIPSPVVDSKGMIAGVSVSSALLFLALVVIVVLIGVLVKMNCGIPSRGELLEIQNY